MVIKAIWLAAEQPCGKSLKAALELWLPSAGAGSVLYEYYRDLIAK